MKISIRPKVLVVEDEIKMLATIMLLLDRSGFDVSGGQTGAEAIQLCRREEFDLVILDVSLPDKSGYEVCAWLREDFRFNRTPIVFISSFWSESDRQRACELGAADCIDKALDGPAFVQRIARHLKLPAR